MYLEEENPYVMEKIKEYKDRFRGDVSAKIEYLQFLGTTGLVDRTISQYSMMFVGAVATYEELFNRDLYDFDTDQTYKLLKGLLKPSYVAIQSDVSILTGYVRYCLNHGMGLKPTHAIYGITREDLIESLNQVAIDERYPTYNEFMSELDLLANFQSKSIWLLAWLGLYNTNYQAMRELKTDDIDFTNNVIHANYLTKDKDNKPLNIRLHIPLTQAEAHILNIAKEEEGVFMQSKHKKIILRRYHESPYFLKANNKNAKSDIVSRATIFSRIKDTSNRHWKTKSIYVAGVAYRMLQEKEDWRLRDIEQYIKDNHLSVYRMTLYNMLEGYKEKLKIEKESHLKEVAPTAINNS